MKHAHMRLGQADENTPLLTAMIRVIIEAGCPTLSLSLTGLRCSPRSARTAAGSGTWPLFPVSGLLLSTAQKKSTTTTWFQGTRLFSPDSRHTLYVAAYGKGKWSLVLDGHEGDTQTGDLVTGVVFDSPTTFHLLARREDDFMLLEGETRSE